MQSRNEQEWTSNRAYFQSIMYDCSSVITRFADASWVMSFVKKNVEELSKGGSTAVWPTNWYSVAIDNITKEEKRESNRLLVFSFSFLLSRTLAQATADIESHVQLSFLSLSLFFLFCVYSSSGSFTTFTSFSSFIFPRFPIRFVFISIRL